MTDSDRIRSFIAVDLDPTVLAAVGSLQRELAGCAADVRWVRPAGMHVTLKFLGGIAPSLLDQVHHAVQQALADRPAVRLLVRGLGAFPSLQRPRVLWVGLTGAGLALLAEHVEGAVTPLGFAAERRRFSPHLTLGRVNSLRGWPQLKEIFAAHAADDFGATTISAVTVYRSVLRPDGAVYTPLYKIVLHENKEGAIHDNGR